MGGHADTPVTPGTSVVIDLQITNPNPEPITLGSVSTSVTTTNADCTSANFPVTHALLRPVTVPALSSTTLSELGVAQSDWPTVAMLETGTDQDGCRNVPLTLHFTGEATG
jgi:hypothetical protein